MSPEESGSLRRAERIQRTRARSWVLHVLYRWESEGTDRPLPQVLDEILRSHRMAPPRIPLVRRHLETIAAHLDEIDGAIRGAMENWRLERLSRIDRSILRLATAELLYHSELPGPISIQEGIRLAGQYGGNESPRFVNGVLDAIYHRFTAIEE